MTDLYGILGVSPTAPSDEIRRAYKRRARATHPDVNKTPGAEAAFRAVVAAYEALSDPNERAAYDRARRGQAVSVSEPVTTWAPPTRHRTPKKPWYQFVGEVIVAQFILAAGSALVIRLLIFFVEGR